MPSLAGSDGLDSTAVAFLVDLALKKVKGEEKEQEKEKVMVMEELDVLSYDQPTIRQQRRLDELDRSGAVRAWAAAVLPGSRRKKKEKRKKKVPTSSSRSSSVRAAHLDILTFFLQPFVLGGPVYCLVCASTADTCSCVGIGNHFWTLLLRAPCIRESLSCLSPLEYKKIG